MEIDPSNQDDLWRQLDEIRKVFIFLGQSHDFWSILKFDTLGDVHSDNLPDNTQNHMRSLFDEIPWINSNNSDTKTLGCGNAHLQVFFNLVNIHVLLSVQSSRINTLWVDSNENLAQENTVVEGMEKRITLRANWNSVFAILIGLQHIVDHSSEGCYFF